MANGALKSIFMYLELSREPRLTSSKLLFGGDDQPYFFLFLVECLCSGFAYMLIVWLVVVKKWADKAFLVYDKSIVAKTSHLIYAICILFFVVIAAINISWVISLICLIVITGICLQLVCLLFGRDVVLWWH